MQLAPVKPAAPAPAVALDQAKELRVLANALEVQDMLDEASKLVNELTRIAHHSEALSRNPLTNKPTAIKLTPVDAQRSEYILKRLNELSEKYTARMSKPADHVHADQPAKFKLAAAKMQKDEPAKAKAAIAKFEGCRAKFVKDGSKPVNFLSSIPGTVAVIQAALKARHQQKMKDQAEEDHLALMRMRLAGEIDGAARVVKNEADVSGTVGASEANKLNITVAAGARIGVGVGTYASAAMKDVSDDLRVRRHATPFDSLRTMRPAMV